MLLHACVVDMNTHCGYDSVCSADEAACGTNQISEMTAVGTSAGAIGALGHGAAAAEYDNQ